MNVSLDGLLAGVERSLRSSKDDMACAYAYTLMEFGENLRLVKAGKATLDELFGLYKLADQPTENLPDCTTVADAFWEYEARFGYDKALEMTAEEFGITTDQVEALVIDDDALNNGNG